MTPHNFNAGPAVLPQPVLHQIRDGFLDFAGTGMSILEISHRSREFETLVEQAEHRLLRLLGASQMRALFLQGGASTQFAMVPLNFLPAGASADYVLTGLWSEKAYEEAARLGVARVAGSSRGLQYRRIPDADGLARDPRAAYLHLTSNNTIYGTQWHAWPERAGVPLVADMSSDILSRPLPIGQFDLIYAGAQKNLGPAGVTVVLISEALLATASTAPPTMLRYATHAAAGSLYNTPPVFAIYALDLVLRWIEAAGGLAALAGHNQRKAAWVYAAIDQSDGFYRGHAEPASRSLMNITFRLADVSREPAFLAAAATAGFVGLAGHRSVGGIRASLYNALPEASCIALADFMRDFARRTG
ncbi:MAG: 3-phosphoserine/phosphohydroxythreonine transaminase [Chloroflexi bacterium]|nr:3-phosphoserine/phosphohydroxythreonine transaminase [Chloroflexota bacterium]